MLLKSIPALDRPTVWPPLCYAQRKAFGWVRDRAREIAEAARLAPGAIQAGNNDAVALGTGGYVLAFVVHELDTGAAFIERALAAKSKFRGCMAVQGMDEDLAITTRCGC